MYYLHGRDHGDCLAAAAYFLAPVVGMDEVMSRIAYAHSRRIRLARGAFELRSYYVELALDVYEQVMVLTWSFWPRANVRPSDPPLKCPRRGRGASG